MTWMNKLLHMLGINDIPNKVVVINHKRHSKNVAEHIPSKQYKKQFSQQECRRYRVRLNTNETKALIFSCNCLYRTT